MDTGYIETYRQLYGTAPPETVARGSSSADILNEGRGFMAGFDVTMQLQVGCPGRCRFCYVSTGGTLTPVPVRGEDGQSWGFVVRDKTRPIEKLRKHVAAGALAGKSVYWSGVTDPYAAPPKTTQGVWNTLCDAPENQRPVRVAVQSRFRPDRDAAVMAEYADSTDSRDGGPPVVVSYSIGTDRDDLIRAWERATPLFEQRMQCIDNLAQAGLMVVATLSPLGPWKDLRRALNRMKAMGVAYVTVLFFKCGTRSANTPSPFLRYLRNHYPEVLDPMWQEDRLSEIREVLGANSVLTGQAGFASLAAPHLAGSGSANSK